MKTTVIIDHPWNEGFNHALLNEIVSGLEKDGKDYEVIDLYQDGFNPVMTTEELSCYQSGTTKDPLVQRYIDIIKETEQLVLVFPIWWYSCPAGLKGFMDKVLLNGVAFADGEDGLIPLLKVKHVRIFTTTEQTTEGIYAHGNDCFRSQLTTTFSDVGCQNIEWFNLGQVSSLTQEERVAHLDEAYSKLM